MSMLDEKRIETLTMKVKDIKTGFGNPRKIGKKEERSWKNHWRSMVISDCSSLTSMIM